MPVTVLVVDDHAGFRACARRLLEGQGYRVVGEPADGGLEDPRAARGFVPKHELSTEAIQELL